MNIAYYTYNQCEPSLGGTERTTALMAKTLNSEFGYNIFSIYYQSVDIKENNIFMSSLRISEEYSSEQELVQFIIQNKIRIIINQGDFHFGKKLSKIIKKYSLNCAHIFALHFSPGSFEKARISLNERIRVYDRNKSILNKLKIIFHPIYYRILNNWHRKQYEYIQTMADKVVLLSENFVKEWVGFTGSKPIDSRKFVCIPNGATFDHYANENEILRKEKKVLIVARLDERQKQLSKALKIWKRLSNHTQIQDWKLDIVGDGPDKEFYEHLIETEKLSNVYLHGYQNPEEYYEKSSLFMMTSDFEGFSMTLVEASQFGVIPFAFNTFSALSDIIDNKYNGFIIPSNDMEAYYESILSIISDDSKRFVMGLNAVENAKRFNPKIIASKWNDLFLSVLNRSEIISTTR